MKLKQISLGLAIVMLTLAFVGCGSKSQTTAETTGQSASTAQQSAQEPPITLTAFFAAPAQDFDKSDIANYLKEKTGVSLQIEYLVGDVKTKASVMTASGEYPDLIWGGEVQSTFQAAKAFIPLDDLIEKFGENTKKLYGNSFGKIRSDDGKIYWLPWAVGDVVRAFESSGLYIQRAVLKEFGYPKITTFQEYLDLIEKYKAKYPEINGKKTIGIELLTDDWRDFTIQNCPMNMIGYPNDGNLEVDPTTFQAKTFALNPEAKQFYKMMNDAYLKGLLDPESFTDKYDQWLAKLSAGNVLAIGYNQQWQVAEAMGNLKKQGLNDRVMVALPVVLNNGDKEKYQWPGSMVVRDGVAISVSCKEPERAFKFLEYIQSEEVQKLLHWGFKDKDYIVDSNGRMTRTPEQIKQLQDNEYTKKTGVGEYAPWPTAPNITKYSDGNSWDPSAQDEVIAQQYDEFDKEVLNAYSAKVYADMFAAPVDSPYGVAWDILLKDGSPEVVANQNLRQAQEKYLPKMMVAKAGQFDSIWSEYEQAVKKIDLKVYEDAVTAGIKQRMEAWGKK